MKSDLLRLTMACVLGSLLGYGFWLGVTILPLWAGSQEFLVGKMAEETFWTDTELMYAWTLGMLVGAFFASHSPRRIDTVLQRWRYLLYPILGSFLGLLYGMLCEQVYILLFNPIELFRYPTFSPYGWAAGLLIGALYAIRR